MVLHSVKNVLALNGIESFIKNEFVHSVGVRHGITNTFHELWIYNDGDYEAAGSLIENEVEKEQPEGTWVCADCDEENDLNFEIYWKCQSAQPAQA